MPIINWKDSYEVGISTIDLQHQNLFNVINAFYQGIEKKSNREAMLSLINELKKYSQYHFDSEEALMKQFDFIGYASHKKEHEKFVNMIDEFEERYKNGHMVLSLEVTAFLQDWVQSHILKKDQEYSAFLTSRGAS